VSSVSHGGAFYIDHGNMDINFAIAVAFSNIKSSSGKGGVFYFARVKNVALTGNTFTNIQSALSGSVMYSEAPSLVLTLTSNQIDCKAAVWVALGLGGIDS
jgi:hypothetical protein